ncbi:MAG: beta-glucosidase [Omnitrophica WOR_2 bacterium SM23_29]|nr:MAG: beta-glucosidase [Omnitrophica WOR_2 bacterium SM23_29]
MDEVKIYNRALTAEDVLTRVYKDPRYPLEVRVEDLLSKMTLDEKIGQMTQSERNGVTVDDIRDYLLGSVFSGGGSSPYPNTPEGWADMYDAFQSSAVSTRLEIPILYGSDAVHGHNNVYGATIFPHNIGLGATRDPNLIEQIGTIVAKEVAATGVDWTFAPCLTVPRNEQWGRTYEGFGEIPEIGELLAGRYITGFQGPDMDGGEHIIACTKHWVGDGGTTDGMDQGNTVCSEQELRNIHIAPYIPALNTKVGTVMVSYSSWNGDPLHGHKYLITDVLKNELEFDGFVVSDWNGIDKIYGDFPNRVKTAVNAGIDMFMQPYNWKNFISTLKGLVQSGDVPMSRIDDAVRRILRVKFTFGLFENSYTDRNLTYDGSFGSAEHRAVARDAVRKSLVLLKNENNILPLSPDIGSVFVAGKNANDIGNQCGGWTITWQGSSGDITVGTTVLEGIQNVVSPITTVTFSEDGTGAAGHDVAIVVIGERPYAEVLGDSSDLSLDNTDQTCLNNVLSADIPVIVILVSGRPMIVTDEITDWDAFVAAWLPGTEGEGVAEVLFGDYNFTGKLPCSWPRSMGQIPINHGDLPYDPLFPYGFGLTCPF